MAFFDDLLSGVLSDGTTSALIKGAATIGGALLSNGANSSAADTSGQAQLAAAQIAANANQNAINQFINYGTLGRQVLGEAKDKGLAAIDTGTQQYADTVNPLLTPNPILLPSYRGLTDQQQRGESELMRNGQAQLAASGLRGAGRAGISALLDADKKYQEDARAQNDTDTRTELRRAQGVSNNARSNLGNIYASAGGSKANVETNTGSQVSNNLTNVGNVVSNLTSNTGASTGNAVANAGNTQAQAGLANAKVDSSALGSLGSIIASGITGNSGVIGSKPAALAGDDPFADGGAAKGSV